MITLAQLLFDSAIGIFTGSVIGDLVMSKIKPNKFNFDRVIYQLIALAIAAKYIFG